VGAAQGFAGKAAMSSVADPREFVDLLARSCEEHDAAAMAAVAEAVADADLDGCLET